MFKSRFWNLRKIASFAEETENENISAKSLPFASYKCHLSREICHPDGLRFFFSDKVPRVRLHWDGVRFKTITRSRDQRGELILRAV